MTGQVKEEVLTRFGELGLRVSAGAVRFEPRLLQAREFLHEPHRFRYVDVNDRWQDIEVPAPGLAFTWCQVPVVYRLCAAGSPSLTVSLEDGSTRTLPDASLPADLGSEVFRRSGRVRQVSVDVPAGTLFVP